MPLLCLKYAPSGGQKARRAITKSWIPAIFVRRLSDYRVAGLQIAVAGGRSRKIGPLPAGNYDLQFKSSGKRVRLQVAAGVVANGIVSSGARRLELKNVHPLSIASVTSTETDVIVTRTFVADASPHRNPGYPLASLQLTDGLVYVSELGHDEMAYPEVAPPLRRFIAAALSTR